MLKDVCIFREERQDASPVEVRLQKNRQRQETEKDTGPGLHRRLQILEGTGTRIVEGETCESASSEPDLLSTWSSKAGGPDPAQLALHAAIAERLLLKRYGNEKEVSVFNGIVTFTI